MKYRAIQQFFSDEKNNYSMGRLSFFIALTVSSVLLVADFLHNGKINDVGFSNYIYSFTAGYVGGKVAGSVGNMGKKKDVADDNHVNDFSK